MTMTGYLLSSWEVAVLPAAVSRAVLLAEAPLAEAALAEDGDAFDS